MPDVLTERHLEVLKLAAAGLTNAQIARKLHLQQDTVKSHLRHLYQRLGVTGGRAHAVAVAYQRGLLHMPVGSTPIVLAPRIRPAQAATIGRPVGPVGGTIRASDAFDTGPRVESDQAGTRFYDANGERYA